jgi:hypothetical protein
MPGLFFAAARRREGDNCADRQILILSASSEVPPVILRV